MMIGQQKKNRKSNNDETKENQVLAVLQFTLLVHALWRKWIMSPKWSFTPFKFKHGIGQKIK